MPSDFYSEELPALRSSPELMVTPFRLSGTVYSIYLYLYLSVFTKFGCTIELVRTPQPFTVYCPAVGSGETGKA
jgi:hypothetical protein